MDLLSIIGLLIIIYYFVYAAFSFILDCDIKLAFNERFGKSISSLKGKNVWIVGASSGIGEELAYILAEAGCKLILSARRAVKLEQVKKKCLKLNRYLNDEDVEIYPLDLLEFNLHEEAFNYVINKFGKLDILVNNAGRSQRAQWENIEIAVDREIFELNVFPILSLSRMAVKYFLEVGEGHIVVTSSIAGIAAIPMSASYCASKHALHGYFKSLLLEHNSKNIDITMVCPGPVQTDFLSESFTEISGQKYGKDTIISGNKVSAKRCATLMGIAIANKLNEVWIAKPSTMRLIYIMYHFPNFIIWLMKTLGLNYIMKLRDGKTSNK